MTQTLYAYMNNKTIKIFEKIINFCYMEIKIKIKVHGCQVPVAHTCELLSYSGHRDQEDRGSGPAQANSSATLYLEK
jgi:hypothetical protein